MYKAKLYKEYHDGMRTTTQITIIEAETIEQLHIKILPARNNGFHIASVVNPHGYLVYLS